MTNTSTPRPSRTLRVGTLSSGGREEVRPRQNRIIMKTFTRWWTVRNMLRDINNITVRQVSIYKSTERYLFIFCSPRVSVFLY